MELDDLRSEWESAGQPPKTKEDLLRMTKIAHHPSLKKIRIKLLLETVFLLFFLIVYYDWFDGGQKPLYANIVLIIGLLLYIGNDIIGYISIAKPIMAFNLKLSVANYSSRIKHLALFSIIFSFLYGACLIVFFSSVIHFTREKRLLLVALALVLFQVIFWSSRVWKRRIQSLEKQVNDFEDEGNG